VFACEVPTSAICFTPQKHPGLKGVGTGHGEPRHLDAHFRGMQWDSGDAGSALKPLFAPAGNGVASPHQRKVAQAWALHTSDTSRWPEI